jgi:oxalate decarboxylase/phosphoglucose isomerase-like protein (cupin superfamily)
MMVLPPQRYRSAHRHGTGVTIIGVTKGDGFAVMYPEGGEKVRCPWTEASVFVPPNNWYHQHVNSGSVENRQLRVFPPRALMNYEDSMSLEMSFIDEDPLVRQQFGEALAKNGLTSMMPEQICTGPDFEWDEGSE